MLSDVLSLRALIYSLDESQNLFDVGHVHSASHRLRGLAAKRCSEVARSAIELALWFTWILDIEMKTGTKDRNMELQNDWGESSEKNEED